MTSDNGQERFVAVGDGDVNIEKKNKKRAVNDVARRVVAQQQTYANNTSTCMGTVQ